MTDQSSSNQQSNQTSQANQTSKAVLKQLASVARNRIEDIGSWIDAINAKRNQTTSYRPADLSKSTDAMQNILREHTLKTSSQFSSQLMGNRFASYAQILKRIIPNDTLDKGVDAMFEQLADMAESWSKIELSTDRKIADYSKLTNDEKNALAKDIANQNRALATMGGVSGLAGLAGMFADTLWLLLVSLRTIYQLAAVYGQPLTGKKGIQTAYAVIASSDLSQMQPKQAILAGLGVVATMLNSAEENGLQKELKEKIAGSGFQHQQLNQYAEQVDKMAENFELNLDDINLKWVKRLLSFGSVAVGAHYNSILIEQIIGTTEATFAPEMKMVNTSFDNANPDNLNPDNLNPDNTNIDEVA